MCAYNYLVYSSPSPCPFPFLATLIVALTPALRMRRRRCPSTITLEMSIPRKSNATPSILINPYLKNYCTNSLIITYCDGSSDGSVPGEPERMMVFKVDKDGGKDLMIAKSIILSSNPRPAFESIRVAQRQKGTPFPTSQQNLPARLYIYISNSPRRAHLARGPSSSHHGSLSLFGATLQDYRSQAGTRLVDHPPANGAKQLKRYESVGSITTILHGSVINSEETMERL